MYLAESARLEARAPIIGDHFEGGGAPSPSGLAAWPVRPPLALPVGTAGTGLVVPATAGPGEVLRAARTAPPGTTVYVIGDGRLGAVLPPAVAGAVVVARSVGAAVLAAPAGRGPEEWAGAIREWGLARRHEVLTVVSGPHAAAVGLELPAAPLPPHRRLPPPFVPVPCRILDEQPGALCAVVLGTPPVEHLVAREHLSSVHDGEGLLRCEVVHLAGRMLTVDVPGVPIDGPGTADIRLDAWLEGLVRIRAAAGRAAIIGPTPARALAAPGLAHVAVLVASKNGSCSIAETVRSAADQADVYVVSDGSDDDTVAVAAAAGATVLALETNLGKPAALRAAIGHFGLTRRYEGLVVLDDDTVIEPNFVAEARRRMEPGVAIVVGQTMTRWTDEHRWNVWLGSRAYGYWRYQTTLRRGQSALNVMTCISGSNSVYRSDLLDQVLVEKTPYIVDDTYWTLETHRRNLGRIVYAPDARAQICDPTNLRDWYRQNLRWIWGSFQGIWGHRVGRHRTLFDVTFAMQILDWAIYVLLTPVLLVLGLWKGWVSVELLVWLSVIGYSVGAVFAAVVLRKWRLALMVPALVAIDWIYRAVFIHAFVKTVRQPRVASCRWDSPARYT